MEAKDDEGVQREDKIEEKQGIGSTNGKPLSVNETSVVVQRVMEFAMSSDFETAFEKFALDNTHVFECILDMEPNCEHPMSWHQCYLDYLKTFESKLEKFIDSIGYSLTEFYRDCQHILESDEVWGDTKFFLTALLATSEYEAFVSLMKGEMMSNRNKQRSASGSNSPSKSNTNTNTSVDSKLDDSKEDATDGLEDSKEDFK